MRRITTSKFPFFLVILVIVSIYAVYEFMTNHRSLQTNATVKGVQCWNRMGRVLVKDCTADLFYTVDGKSYSIPYNYQEPLVGTPLVEGDKKPVYYNPSDPTDASITGNTPLGMIIVVTIVVGIFFIWVASGAMRRYEVKPKIMKS